MYTPYYNGYQPTYFQPQDQLAQLKQAQYQPPSSSIIWVQGEAAARAYMVAAGNSVLLMDSDASVFYLKSTDASGMPQPMRIFDYTERTGKTTPETSDATVDYVTREEFATLKEEMKALSMIVKETQHVESTV